MITPEPVRPASTAELAVEIGRGRLRFVLTRLRLMWRSFRSGWSIFMESRVGMLSLFTIILFALMAAAHPILMATVWDPATYDPVTGYSFGQLEQPAPPSWKHPLGDRPLGTGRAEPTAVQHPLRVRAGNNRRTGDRGHRNLRGGCGRILRRAAGCLLHAAGRLDNRPAGHIVADSVERPFPSEPVLPGL